MYTVYILECRDKTLYTGYTTKLDRRISEHNLSTSGAKYTASRRPVKLVYYESYPTQRLAMQREAEIKKLTRSQKLDLIKKSNGS
jgi:putative endonuclease